MTDLEMTRLCALAMGLDCETEDEWGNENVGVFIFTKWGRTDYDPLHDDAQAMALVKKLSLTVTPACGVPDYWRVEGCSNEDKWIEESVNNADLNRAIVECCARMQKAKA